jgi:hypothetical protein
MGTFDKIPAGNPVFTDPGLSQGTPEEPDKLLELRQKANAVAAEEVFLLPSTSEPVEFGHRTKDYGRTAITLYEDNRSLIAVYKFDVSGALNFLEPVALFDEFLLQSVVEANRDNVQYVLGSDAPKIYVMGQGHRIFSISAILLDTDLDHPLSAELTPFVVPNAASASLLRFKGWSGTGLTAWQTFYDNYASLAACGKNRTLVGFQYMNRTFYGAFLNVSLAHSADQPHVYELSTAFYALSIENLS